MFQKRKMEQNHTGTIRRHSISLGLRRLSLIGSDQLGVTNSRRLSIQDSLAAFSKKLRLGGRSSSRDSSDCEETHIDKGLVQRALAQHFRETELKVRRNERLDG